MSYVVAKPFNSTLRRYRAGDHVDDGPELQPHTVASLQERGFVEGGRPALAASVFTSLKED